MKIFRPACVVVVSIVLSQAAAAQQLQPLTCKARNVEPECHGHACEVVVPWPAEGERVFDINRVHRGDVRLTTNSTLALTIVGVNFLKYSLQPRYQDQMLDTASALQTLVSAVAAPVAMVPQGVIDLPESAPFGASLDQWSGRLRAVADRLDVSLRRFQKVTVTDSERAVIADLRFSMLAAREDLDAVRARVLDELRSGSAGGLQRFQAFSAIEAIHQLVVSRLEAFIEGARLTCEGWTWSPPRTEKGGTVVVVTLTPLTSTRYTQEAPLAISYLVHSAFPFVVSAGYAYTTLADVRFEQVRGLGGQDLYGMTRNEPNTHTLAAYLSYSLKPIRIPMLVTAGTDVARPGDRTFVGASVEFKKAVFSIGVANGSVLQGNHPVQEPVSNGSTTLRTLYGDISADTQWKTFAGISFVVF